jgi:hypothetical protein
VKRTSKAKQSSLSSANNSSILLDEYILSKAIQSLISQQFIHFTGRVHPQQSNPVSHQPTFQPIYCGAHRTRLYVKHERLPTHDCSHNGMVNKEVRSSLPLLHRGRAATLSSQNSSHRYHGPHFALTSFDRRQLFPTWYDTIIQWSLGYLVSGGLMPVVSKYLPLRYSCWGFESSASILRPYYLI